MTRWMTFFAVSAFAIATLGAGAEAHAYSVRVRIDNFMNPIYENAKSTATLRVCIFVPTNTPTTVECVDKVLDVVASNHHFDFFLQPWVSSPEVTKITLQMIAPGDLTDLLIIDQVELFDCCGHLRKEWGTDNSFGWCFSSQSGDFGNSHCQGTALAPNGVLTFPQ